MEEERRSGDEIQHSANPTPSVPAAHRADDRGVRPTAPGLPGRLRRRLAATPKQTPPARPWCRPQSGLGDLGRQAVLHLVLLSPLPDATRPGLLVRLQPGAGQPVDSPVDAD